jgi:hypothetical protein
MIGPNFDGNLMITMIGDRDDARMITSGRCRGARVGFRSGGSLL